MTNELRSTYRGGTNVEIPIAYLDALRLQVDSFVKPVDGSSTVFDNNRK